MIKVSVIIPVYNSEGTIKKCIDSVLANDYGNFEIVVVDDSSKDGTMKIVEQIKDSRLLLIENEKNSGPALSRNHGIKESRGEIILFLDADSFVEQDWIKKHVLLHSHIPAEIIGGAIVGVYKTIFGKCDGFCNWWTSIPCSKDRYVKKLHLPTNNMSLKRKVFDKIGYFNEALQSGEDAEFCFRALKNGITIFFKCDLATFHHEKDSFAGFLKHQEKWGAQVVKMRKAMNMNYSFLIPNSLLMAYLYIVPLTFLLTFFVIFKWIRYYPSIIFYLPIIFIGKMYHVIAIKNTFIKDTKF